MKRLTIKLAMVAGGGCLLFLACPTFDIWPAAWVAFVPALLAVRELSPRRAFLWGWLMGAVANGGGFYWLRTLLERFGHMRAVRPSHARQPARLACARLARSA